MKDNENECLLNYIIKFDFEFVFLKMIKLFLDLTLYNLD